MYSLLSATLTITFRPLYLTLTLSLELSPSWVPHSAFLHLSLIWEYSCFVPCCFCCGR